MEDGIIHFCKRSVPTRARPLQRKPNLCPQDSALWWITPKCQDRFPAPPRYHAPLGAAAPPSCSSAVGRSARPFPSDRAQPLTLRKVCRVCRIPPRPSAACRPAPVFGAVLSQRERFTGGPVSASAPLSSISSKVPPTPVLDPPAFNRPRTHADNIYSLNIKPHSLP